MRGRKPNLQLVTPTCDEAGPTPPDAREAATVALIRQLRPRGLDREVSREWDRVARLLADPIVDRLKPRFVDVILEYCRVMVRLRKLREFFDRLAQEHAAAVDAETKPKPDALTAEVHKTDGRHGEQLKSHPLVAQTNECWRQWRALVQMLGLSPADERNMLPGQGDLFDESERYFS